MAREGAVAAAGPPRTNSAGRAPAGQGGQSNTNNADRPQCQVCFKFGHTAIDCWHRFEEGYVPEQKNVHAATSSYNVDTNWYTDTGATDHITGELEKLSVRDRYKGNDQIHTASGAGMEIRHVGHSVVQTPSHDLHLNNILHVPMAKKNIISVHCLASDNSAFLEFHPNFFLIKDHATRSTLLRDDVTMGYIHCRLHLQ